ncbi:GNAT family N-acetyltransferase [Arsenophonus endosymbiont of Aphis craccivora]|uniref:GNAT family N-acetyltransferase n=1 Tax=Arsenophonus endosymbiont of Aphis craccivora TaxID=1231049 RepID=UPI0015DC0585|nr:GNAT family N-acetyltransferase [Arsenophonus endosymbiont of Aphis craccivora]QLK88273.1 GNAT family N-acetyltransferase [Arsenophonus endosymbiont of Aphis craccivora]
MENHYLEQHVRLANVNDIASLFAIRTSVKENHLSKKQLIDKGITPDALRDILSASPCAWIAEIAGNPIGFSMVDMSQGSIFALFVRPEFAGQGFGKILLTKAETFLFQQYKKIWLTTDAASRACGFYQKLGWLPVENLQNGEIRLEKLIN